jgi:hypothetical protein
MAATDPGPSRVPSSSGVIPAEWPAQAADLVVDTIDKVKDRTTRPATVAARGLVYGVLAGIVGLVAVILLVIAIIRLWDVYVPGNVWIIYAMLGIAGTLGGAVLLSKANSPADPPM